MGREMERKKLGMENGEVEKWAWDGMEGRKMWPDYLIFFEALESVLEEHLTGSAYGECWRGWNSFFHDDERRKGDVAVWCLEGGKGGTELVEKVGNGG